MAWELTFGSAAWHRHRRNHRVWATPLKRDGPGERIISRHLAAILAFVLSTRRSADGKGPCVAMGPKWKLRQARSDAFSTVLT